MSKKNKIKLYELDYHEALDRTHLIGCMINDYLTTHQICLNKKNKKIKKKFVKAEDCLAKAYQMIGNSE